MKSPPRIPVLDLHAHFPMQLRVPPRKVADDRRRRMLFLAVNALLNFEPLNTPRVRLDSARDQNISFGSVLYNPGDEFCVPDGPYESVQAQIELVEAKLQSDRRFRIVRDPEDLDRTVQGTVSGGPQAVFHCLEGGFGVDDPANVAALAERGVAYVTLAHLLFGDISSSVNAFPCLNDEQYRRMFYQPAGGLTARGAAIAAALFDHGVAVDITHMTSEAIDDVFRIAAGRPVICSHTGVRATSSDEYLLNLDRGTIERIAACGGLIGVIFYEHWLRPPPGPRRPPATIERLLEAIESIRAQAGVACLAIGSDLDGFIKPVHPLEDYSRMDALRAALLAAYDQETVERILWKNAVDVLKACWRKRGSPGR
jgi:membrane dipeptidase